MPGMDDLVPAILGGRDQPHPYAQGVIQSWDPDTFENVVRVHGENLRNLPVKSSVEALTYKAGDTVILARWPSSRRGMSSWWIDGRAVIPGTGRGEEAIAFMTTALGSAVARAVIGNSVYFGEVSGNADLSYPSSTFVDPDSGDPGPTVEDVPVTDSGRVIVTFGASINPHFPDTSLASHAMGISVTGATTVPATTARETGPIVGTFGSDGTDGTLYIGDYSRSELITGLNEGLHTFTAKYRAQPVGGIDTSTGTTRFTDRYIQVIAF